MILESITLKNYRQYVNSKILFPLPKDGENFTVIQGANGSGKTNLLNAITWCLYAKEKHLKEKYRGLPIISTQIYKKMDSGDIEQVVVEIQMLDDDSAKIIFRRSLNYRKSEDGNIKQIPDTLSPYHDGSKFEILRQIKNDIVLVESPNYILSRLIPESLEEYFFFDGERLNDYFMENSGEKIKDEVFKISQLDVLESTIYHLKKKKDEFFKESSKLNSKAEQIGETIDTLRPSLDKSIELLEQKKKDKIDAERKEKEYNELLNNSGQNIVTDLQTQREERNNMLDQIDTDLETENKSKLDYLIDKTPHIFLYTAILRTLHMIAEKEESGDIPSDYKRNFIEKLLNHGTCICGTDISNDNEFRENIVEFLQKSNRISDISEELIKHEANLKSFVDNSENFKNKIDTYNDKISNFENRIKTISKKLIEISEKLTNLGDVEDIDIWENKRFEYQKLKNELLISIGISIEQNKSTEKQIISLENELDQELVKEKLYAGTKKMITFCNKSLDRLKNIKNEIMEDFRNELEEKTKLQFFGLIWKKQNYNDITINEDYELSVVHQSGLEGIDTLSAGERQVLALSFVAALNSVSGFDVPIVIDTPLVSSQPYNVVNYIMYVLHNQLEGIEYEEIHCNPY